MLCVANITFKYLSDTAINVMSYDSKSQPLKIISPGYLDSLKGIIKITLEVYYTNVEEILNAH